MGAKLVDARLELVTARAADLTRSRLAGATFTRCALIGARLDYADLAGTSLCECVLTDATVVAADFHRLVDEKNEWAGVDRSLAKPPDPDRLRAETFRGAQ